MTDPADAVPAEILPERVSITREGLSDGSLLARIRAQLPPGMIVRSDAEIDASLDQTLASHDPAADVWVFGYGSLMWNPAFSYAERQVGVIRGKTLILNLPGQPKAIKETLDGIFPAVPYCIDLIGGPYIETHEAVCKTFRPKSALRPPAG